MFYLPIIPHQGGIQRVTESIALGLKKRGHHICFLSILPYQDNGYEFPVIQYYLDYITDFENASREYVEIIKQNKINVVINQQPRPDLLRILALTPIGVKRITCYHGQPFPDENFTREQLKYYKRTGLKEKLYKNFCRTFPAYYRKKTRLYARQEWENSLGVSDSVCLLSERYVQRVLKYMPEIDKNILVAINNPSPIQTCQTERLCKEKIILWVGRHDNGTKNFPVFVDFWIQFQKTHSDWQAVVLGNGPDWEYNRNYARKKNTERMYFLGNVSNVHDYYKRATFLFMTSFWEGWGMVLVESMNFGCIPCAFNTYESLHDIVEDGKSGIIIPPFNIKCANRKVSSLIENKKNMEIIQTKAIEKAHSFNVDKISTQWENFLASVCKR